MKGIRDIDVIMRMAAYWLLFVTLFFGPLALGSAAAISVPSKECASSCPCDRRDYEHQEEEEVPHAEAACDDTNKANSNHDHDDPCQEGCPDDCSKCSCCFGVALAMLPPLAITGLGACSSSSLLAPVDEPAHGFSSGVYRPPRFPS